MPKTSAGLLVYRRSDAGPEVFLVHPGGPFFAKKDAGAWTIPKGELSPGEDPLDCARREFTEETGRTIAGPFAALGTIRQAGGKLVHAFVAAADFDATTIVSNTFKLEWPPRSGRWTSSPKSTAPAGSPSPPPPKKSTPPKSPSSTASRRVSFNR